VSADRRLIGFLVVDSMRRNPENRPTFERQSTTNSKKILESRGAGCRGSAVAFPKRDGSGMIETMDPSPMDLQPGQQIQAEGFWNARGVGPDNGH